MSESAIQDVTVSMRDGAAMGAALAAPAKTGPGIVIVPAIFGVDDGVRDIMAHWQGRGCAALAIDPFHRTIPGPLSREPDEREKAQKRYKEFDVEQGVLDLEDAVKWLRNQPSCNGKVVVFGYCFGGRYAYLATARHIADGGVSFHGTKIGLNLDEAKNVDRPLSIHVGDQDPSIPIDEVEATKKALAGNPNVEICVYPGCVHGFTGKGRPAYDENADRSSTEAAAELIASISPSEAAPA